MSSGVGEGLANLITYQVLTASIVVFIASLFFIIKRRKTMQKQARAILTVLAVVTGLSITFIGITAFAFGSNHQVIAKPAPLENEIAFASLTAEQQAVVDLLSAPNLEMLIFDFNANEAYRGIELWVETYKDGELVDRPAEVNIFSDNEKSWAGQFAIVINRNPYYQWTLSIVENGARYSHASTKEITVEPAAARASGTIDTPVRIEDGKEIIIYQSLFSMGSIRAYDCQTLQERPELLDDYLYSHLIKCKFTK